MDLILEIFKAYSAAKDVAEAAGSISDWVLDLLKRWSSKTPLATVDIHLGKLAKTTDDEIRKAAKSTLSNAGGKAGSEAEREELIGVVLNLTRNVRYRSAFGSMSGGMLRSDRLLDLLVGDVEPIRRQNEKVAAGSPWKLRRHLGMGSFGEVWLAENPAYPIPRAYKFFTRDQSGQWLKRERESLVAILNRLGTHPHIVQFLDVQSDCEHPYIALEYLGGGSLEEWVVKRDDERPYLEIHEIMRQVIAGVSAAHAMEIAHRDLKPANILLTTGPDIRIKIADFGLARVSSSPRRNESVGGSIAGLVGTELYLPPESRQRGVKRSAARDDVFALGIIWYQLAVGQIERPPYNFASRLLARNVDPRTIELIERCLAHPDERFKDAQELQAALADGLPPIATCPPGVPDVQYLAREYLAAIA